ncbi:unnamed protein product [Dibothriocephalus latus]|uniref:Uncharacterized protein n=1 Tax=Dibothriocephalus latus TaxID=60516 RepID=A0A3P7MV62_DIBLA|nr:unnamed protein product [Dibothriocephalus latus]
MDWHQFLDPQLVLGVGAFALGLANAYVQRHFNRQAQTENTNQPENEEPRVSDATGESEPITSIPIESPDGKNILMQ